MLHDFSLLHQMSGGAVLKGPNFCGSTCYAIVDSGSSYTYVPPQLYPRVIAQVTRGQDCDLTQAICFNTSYESFPTLSFSFGSGGEDTEPNVFRLTPQDYLECDDKLQACSLELQDHG